MRMSFILILAILSGAANAQNTSIDRPEGITIENAYYVGDTKDVVRGRAPKQNIPELMPAGITHVLILRNQRGHEVDDEITALKVAGFSESNILNIKYKWRDIDQAVACDQTAQALEYIRTIEALQGAKLYMHCTAGVDRTSLVSALYRLSVEKNLTRAQAFRTEMCARDYGDATDRPLDVIQPIHEELTPIYLKFAAALIRDRKDGFLQNEFKNICNPQYYNSAETEDDVKENLHRFKCR